MVLRVRNLRKSFPVAGSRSRHVHAVNDVSLHIAPGETLGLVGESGSGKTTVGRIILGLIDPTAGSVQFEIGGPPAARPPRGKVQLVFQEPGESLDPGLRIAATLAEPLQALRVERSEWQRRVREAMALVRLPEALLDALPRQLSAGQQQRVGIARAMITEPALVVLDEPTSALDPTARAEIIDLLRRIQAERETAYLFISHDLSTVRFISHRVAVMYLGMIVEHGEAASLFRRPHHPYASGLLSSVLLPHPDIAMQSAVRLEGEIPSPIDLPPGCFLASRCPFVVERCRRERPPAETVEAGHEVHCFRHGEVAAAQPVSEAFERFTGESERILRRPPAQPDRLVQPSAYGEQHARTS